MDRNLKQKINQKYFDIPKKVLRSHYISRKFGFSTENILAKKSTLYIFNRTTKFDSFFVTHIFKSDFVFIRDEIVKRIYNSTLSESELEQIFENIKILKEENISIVMFPEKNISIFGECSPLPISITNFIAQTKLSIKFFSFYGTYFSYPIWAKEIRKSVCNFNQIAAIPANRLEGLSKNEINFLINNYMPSSASVYSDKFPRKILSNRLAEGLEKFVYACPKCGKFFSIYSEFSCLKCRNCRSATEFDKNGKILLSKNVTNFDELKAYQFDVLKKQTLTDEPLISYENIIKFNTLQPKEKTKVKLTIFPDRVEEQSKSENPTIFIHEISDIIFDYENKVTIVESNQKITQFQGKNNENFYIIFDLYKLQNNKT